MHLVRQLLPLAGQSSSGLPWRSGRLMSCRGRSSHSAIAREGSGLWSVCHCSRMLGFMVSLSLKSSTLLVGSQSPTGLKT